MSPRTLVAVLLLLAMACLTGAQTVPAAPPTRPSPRNRPAPPARSLTVAVSDENGVAIPAARVLLSSTEGRQAYSGATDFAGRARFLNLPAGTYAVRVEKPGFYLFRLPAIAVPSTGFVDATLTHQQEVKQVVNVTASTRTIEAGQTASVGTLTSDEVLNVPYPTTRDVRNILRFIPGVVQDTVGRFHVDGAADYQNLALLDGFDISTPATGGLDMRFSADAVRGVNVERARVSARYSKATGGIMAFNTGMGDDSFRFSATNFIPSAQNKKGLTFDKFVPRATFSGPIRKGKAWFFLAPEFEYDQNIVKELPQSADRNWVLRGSNLAKIQVNLGSRNILSGSYLYNRLHSSHEGLNPFQPLSSTVQLDNNASLFDVKDQHLFANGMLFEIGFASNQFEGLGRPMGSQAQIITPEGLRGNYFKLSADHQSRLQGISNLYLPPVNHWGKHEFLFGIDTDRISYRQFNERRPILIFREDGTLQRQTTFSPAHEFSQHNLEVGAYAQDRWSPLRPLLVEAGLRYDWDKILRQGLLAPRLAATYMLTPDTKLSAGFGWFYDRTNLAFVTAPLDGERFDTLFASDGVTPLGPPLVTRFLVNRSTLQEPRFLNYSLALERKLPGAVYLRAEYIRKRGQHGFAFLNTTQAQLGGDFLLTNTRQDHVDSFQITAHHSFGEGREVSAAYTRSSARSNEVFDFDIDNPVFSQQGAGPLPWNTPNRFLSWGYMPIPHSKRWSFAYSVEVHSGFPFSAVNQNQQVVGAPNRYRFPAFIAIDPFFEYRFTFRGRNLAIRGGFENITGRHNPTSVNNNIDSPEFLKFSGIGSRVFTARIRFLGNK